MYFYFIFRVTSSLFFLTSSFVISFFFTEMARLQRKASRTRLKRKNGTTTTLWWTTESPAFLSRRSTTTRAPKTTNSASKPVFLPKINRFKPSTFYFRWRFWEVGRRRRAGVVQRAEGRAGRVVPRLLRGSGSLNTTVVELSEVYILLICSNQLAAMVKFAEYWDVSHYCNVEAGGATPPVLVEGGGRKR